MEAVAVEIFKGFGSLEGYVNNLGNINNLQSMTRDATNIAIHFRQAKDQAYDVAKQIQWDMNEKLYSLGSLEEHLQDFEDKYGRKKQTVTDARAIANMRHQSLNQRRQQLRNAEYDVRRANQKIAKAKRDQIIATSIVGVFTLGLFAGPAYAFSDIAINDAIDRRNWISHSMREARRRYNDANYQLQLANNEVHQAKAQLYETRRKIQELKTEVGTLQVTTKQVGKLQEKIAGCLTDVGELYSSAKILKEDTDFQARMGELASLTSLADDVMEVIDCLDTISNIQALKSPNFTKRLNGIKQQHKHIRHMLEQKARILMSYS